MDQGGTTGLLRSTRPEPPHLAGGVGVVDGRGREALCKYILRPPLSQERLRLPPGGLVRIELRKPYRDGTYAVDMDPLSLLCRLATSIPPQQRHTVHCGGVLAPVAKLRPSVVPPPAAPARRARSCSQVQAALRRTSQNGVHIHSKRLSPRVGLCHRPARGEWRPSWLEMCHRRARSGCAQTAHLEMPSDSVVVPPLDFTLSSPRAAKQRPPSSRYAPGTVRARLISTTVSKRLDAAPDGAATALGGSEHNRRRSA